MNLDLIAEYLYINPDYLRRVFKKEMNTSISDYIFSVRMKKAKEIIDNNRNIKLSSVCYQVGIRDSSYFSKCFKKYFGMSPSHYESSKPNK